MQLREIEITNFGVFRGEHRFDLRPYPADGRNLVVFVGHNGAGKSTIFQALSLALLGRTALGGRVTQQAYQEFLRGRFHRHADRRGAPAATECGLKLRFEYVRSGRPVEVEVRRRWRLMDRSVSESLSITEDGQPVDVPEQDLPVWLEEMFPLAVASLCLFDAEQLESMSDVDQYGTMIRQAIDRVLGLDLVGRLQQDLTHLTMRRGGARAAERLRDQVVRAQSAVDVAAARLADHQREAEALDHDEENARHALAFAERDLVAAGGTYAVRRPLLQERLAVVERDTREVQDQVRALAADLLPFALAPALCRAFLDRVEAESEARRIQVAQGLWDERVGAVETRLRAESTWASVGIDSEQRDALMRVVLGALRADGLAPPPPDIHHLSDADYARSVEWVGRILTSVPDQARAYGARLRALAEERKSLQRELERAPDDAVLADIHARVAALHDALAGFTPRRRALDQRGASLGAQLAQQERLRDRAGADLAQAQAEEQQMRLVEASKLALRAYEDALLRRHLAIVESALASAFNAVCQKDHLLSSVAIDPETGGVTLRAAAGHEIALGAFSAGERQIFALATLRALREASGRHLPFVVDSPTARLDQAHRRRFLQDYIPATGYQAIMFGTDLELDEVTLALAEPWLARVYRLAYDRVEGRTGVTQEEPWRIKAVALSA